MHIGILSASKENEPREKWGGTIGDVYERFLRSGGGDAFRYSDYHVAGDVFPASVDACDAYIITGSPSGAYETDPWIARLMLFIQEAHAAGKRLVGICFGHQVLAQALGGNVEKSEKGFGFGTREFVVSAEKPWMTDYKSECRLYFSHQDQVIDLPNNAERLASDAFCPNLMYAIEDQVLGLQAHPEFTVDIMADIETMVGDRLPDNIAETHGAITPQPGDNPMFANWIVNFLTA